MIAGPHTGERFAALKRCWYAVVATAKNTIRFARFVWIALRELSPGARVHVHIAVIENGDRSMNRFTLDIPEELHKNLRMAAAEKNVTMRSIILESLEQTHGTSKAKENLTRTAQKQANTRKPKTAK